MQKNTKLAAAGLTVGLLGGGAIAVVAGLPGLAGASTSSVSVQATDDTTVESDDATDATSDDADHTARLQEVLQPLVDAATITQAQADAVIDALVAARPDGGMGHHGRGGFGHGLDAAATALGMTEDELRTELESAGSLADVAAAKGIDVQTVIDAIVADRTADIDQAVADGQITEEQATELKADLTERVTAMVNGETPAGGPMGGRGFGHRHGDDTGDTTDDATS